MIRKWIDAWLAVGPPKGIGWRIAVIMVACTVSLVVMVALKQWTLHSGTPVILKTEPIDPRSLFRGDYVWLNYEISVVDPRELAGDDEFERHDRIYVVLEPGEPYWQPVSIHHQRPEPGEGRVAIRGEVGWIGRDYSDDEELERTHSINVDYGIENYFVPEGEGKELEKYRDEDQVSLRIAVDERGNAGILAVLVNGEVHYRETLF